MFIKNLDIAQVKTPKAAILLLTLGCNLRCKMCHLWHNDETNIVRPSLEGWKKFIVSLKGLSGEGFNVIFGGGEPLLFPDILTELIAFCRQEGFRTSLATSGYFIDEKMAERIVTSGLDYIALTLYSLKKETHNYLRGMPDSYQRLFQAINYLDELRSDAGLEIAIDTVIMEPNLTELLELANWVLQDNRIHSIFFQAVMQPFHSRPVEEWHKNKEYDFLWPKDIHKIDTLIDELIRLKESSGNGKSVKINNPVSQLRFFKSYFRNPQDFIKRFSCNIPNSDVFTISPDGSINLCPYMEPIGNIRNGNIKDIWYSPQAQIRRKEITSCQKNCHHIVNCWYEEE